MATFLLLTGYDDQMAYIGRLTAPLMLDYASRYRMDFQCIRNYVKDSHPSWQKAKHILKAFANGYKAVLWLDADTVITNFSMAPWKQSTHGLNVSQDWHHTEGEPWRFCMGNFLAFDDTTPLWEKVLKAADRWANNPLWEQSCLQELYVNFGWVREKIAIYPRRCYNATLLAGAPELWQRGDWLCHLTSLYPNDRVAAFYDVAPPEYRQNVTRGRSTNAATKQTDSPAFSPITNCLSDNEPL